MADMLGIPLGYLFLSGPPSLTTTIPDLRTASGNPIENPSPELLDVLYGVLRKQSWYREYLESQPGASPLPFIGRFTAQTEPTVIAGNIASTLGIDDEMRTDASNWESFITAFVRKAEATGILVFRTGIVGSNTHRALSPDEFRGFAISDEFAPVVFVNSKDYKVAQVFTLAHELAHLWIGESGISKPDYTVTWEEQANGIERVCDRTAAELLVPEVDFRERWSPERDIRTNIQRLGWHYRVSRYVIVRRAYELGLVEQSLFQNLLAEYRDDYHPPASDSGDYYNSFFARNGSVLSFALMAAVSGGEISKLDAARLLDVAHLDTLNNVQREVFGEASSA